MAVSIHPSLDSGLKKGNADFAGGTLVCKCTSNPVEVSLGSNVSHNHACGCTKCWKPKGATFSVVAVISKDKVKVTKGADKLKVVDPSATIQRHACTGCGVHMYGRIENTKHAFYGPRLRPRRAVAAERLAGASVRGIRVVDHRERRRSQQHECGPRAIKELGLNRTIA
jgi:S-(hydroxymethyl)glutathione synthase